MTKTIVLIHGYGFDYRSWYPVEVAFEGMRTIFLSLPGFGDGLVAQPYTMASLAKTFWEAIDFDGESSVHLIGHSMGGYVCMEMAAQQPLRVASLGLIHSHIFPDSPEKKQQRSATIEQIRLNGRDSVVRRIIPSLFAPGLIGDEIIGSLVQRGLSYSDNAWMFGAEAMRDRPDYSATLKSLRVPVLMVAGEKDAAVPMDVMLQQAAFPERNTLHIYPGVGHMAMYEHTAIFTRDLFRFYQPL